MYIHTYTSLALSTVSAHSGFPDEASDLALASLVVRGELCLCALSSEEATRVCPAPRPVGGREGGEGVRGGGGRGRTGT